MIPNRKDNEDSLFHLICCAICYMQTKKWKKWSDDELNSDLPNDLFLSLDLIRKKTWFISWLSDFGQTMLYNQQSPDKRKRPFFGFTSSGRSFVFWYIPIPRKNKVKKNIYQVV